MKVSIVTACFNSEGTIRDTLDSVAAQTGVEVEHIIVDGASSDSTVEVVQEPQHRVAKLISESDRGIYDAMNKGIAAATGDIVGILNADDFYEYPQALSDVARFFEDSPDVNVVFGDVVFVRPSDLSRVVRYYDSARFRPWKLRFGWMPPHPATFVRKTVYEKYGAYRLGYAIAADFEIFVRWLLVEKVPFARLDRVLVRMRSGGVSTAGLRNRLLLNREIVRACRENGVYTNLFLVLQKFPLKLLELVRRPRGGGRCPKSW